MRILFLARPSYDKFSEALYKCLKEKYINNLEGFFITSNKEETRYIKNNIPNATIFETSKYLKTHWNEFSEEKLIMYEKKYDCKPIWSYILSDRFLVGKSYDYVVNVTVGLFSFFEYIYDNYKIDIYYSEAIATLQCYISYLVGKKHNVRYYSQMAVRGSLDSEYHYFIADPFQYDVNFPVDYNHLSFTNEERQRAEKYLKNFEEKYTIPPGQLQLRTKPRFKITYLLLPLKQMIKSFKSAYNDKYSYMYYKEYRNTTDSIKFFFRYQRGKKYYNKADFSKRYVYYPLHFQPEASTLICAPKYENQIIFIDALAKSLPAGTMLYVKEHYAKLGNRDLHFYDELKRFPNVVLIDPWESSRKLIENAECVATLTGSAGYEAMLLRKPVILGGNTFFENAPGVVKVKDVYLQYTEIIEKWIQPSRDDIIQYLCASFMGYRKGNAYAENDYNLINENIDDLTKSFFDQISSDVDVLE